MQFEAPLALDSRDGQFIHGEISPLIAGPQWCGGDVLRRLRRETLAKRRHLVAPVPANRLAAFLPLWRGMFTQRGGSDRLTEVLDQLAGLVLPRSLWRSYVLSARLSGFRAEDLDRLCAAGEIIWVGRGSSGPRDT